MLVHQLVTTSNFTQDAAVHSLLTFFILRSLFDQWTQILCNVLCLACVDGIGTRVIDTADTEQYGDVRNSWKLLCIKVCRLTRADDKLARSLCHFVELVLAKLLVAFLGPNSVYRLARVSWHTQLLNGRDPAILSLMQPCWLQISAIMAWSFFSFFSV